MRLTWPVTDVTGDPEVAMRLLPVRLKVLTAIGVLAGSLGAAALAGAFAAPAPDAQVTQAIAPPPTITPAVVPHVSTPVATLRIGTPLPSPTTDTSAAAPRSATPTIAPQTNVQPREPQRSIQPPVPLPREREPDRGYRGFDGARGVLGLAAGFLGLSQRQLVMDLRNGQTLAQVAQTQGKSSSSLKTFVSGQLKSRLDQAAANGQISEAQEAALLAQENAQLDRLLDSSLAPARSSDRRDETRS